MKVILQHEKQAVLYILFFRGMEIDIHDIGTYIPLSLATNGIELVEKYPIETPGLLSYNPVLEGTGFLTGLSVAK